MSKFKIGDRVRFNQDYYSSARTGSFYRGNRGVVTDVNENLVTLSMDDGRMTVVFEYRLDAVLPLPRPDFAAGNEPSDFHTQEDYLDAADRWLKKNGWGSCASVADLLSVAQWLKDSD